MSVQKSTVQGLLLSHICNTVNAGVPDLVLCMENSAENTNYQVVLSGFSGKFFSVFFAVPRDDILPIFRCPKSVIYCWGKNVRNKEFFSGGNSMLYLCL